MNKAYGALERTRQSAGQGRQSAIERPRSGLERDLVALNNDLATAYGFVEEADATPTTQMVRTVTELQQRFRKLVP